MKKPYMPLLMGDWRMLTSGLRADAKGVLIGLFIHQYHHGSLPQLLEDLQLIEPEVGKVWVSIQHLFPVTGENRRNNPELEDVRAFWSKQAGNGSKGGRPAKSIPTPNPKGNPTHNPKANHHNDIDLDPDQVKEMELRDAFGLAFDERTLEIYAMQFKSRGVNILQELNDFRILVANAWDNYRSYDAGQLRSAFQYQLKKLKQQPNGKTTHDKKQAYVGGLVDDYAVRHAAAFTTGEAPVVQSDGGSPTV
jgi:hypothetical protein